MTETNVETERTAVKTYVPAYQKAEWRAHADELDMSQSEFVRTMVQAGRREFEVEPVEPEDSDTDPGGEGVKDRVIEALTDADTLDWDELVEQITDTIEDQIDDALAELQDANRIRYSGRAGGYTLIEGQE